MSIDVAARARYIWMGGGTKWLIVVSAVFAAVALALIRTPVATAIAATACVIVAVLIWFAVVMIRSFRALPAFGELDLKRGQAIRRKFLLWVAVEVVAIAIA